MTNRDELPPRQSAFALARRLVSGFVALGRLELQHGRQEIGAMLATARRGVVMIGIAIGLVFAALITLLVAVIMALAALTGLPAWLMALLLTLVLIGVAGLIAYSGIRRLKIGPPEETIASVKEEVAWARRLIRRG
ncbi:MAG: phage holin family protein [Chloroflexota bacterium]